MTKIFYIIILCYFHAELHSQWVMQTSGTAQSLWGIYMHDANTGWACGEGGAIIKTTNGGNNWFPLSSGTTQPLSDIQFTNLNTGWCSARIGGKIFKTTNGGNIWLLQFQTIQSIYGIFFSDSLYGWAADFGGKVFRTTNGGNTWDSIIVNSGLRDVQFLDRNTGWVCGIASDIYKSTNGGGNWIQQFGGHTGGGLASISFFNINTGWAVNTEQYKIYKTTNSGTNWLLLDSLPDCFNAHHIFFSSANTGWVSGDCGNVFRTTNGGFNWYQQITGTPTFRQSAYFLNDSLGWSVGGGGIIIKTTNGGAIVQVKQNSEITPSEFQLNQNYPNPFNPVTKIEFKIPRSNFVNIKVYDILGNEITELVNEYLKAGEYEIFFNGSNLSSGVYFYQLTTEKFSASKIMILTK